MQALLTHCPLNAYNDHTDGTVPRCSEWNGTNPTTGQVVAQV